MQLFDNQTSDALQITRRQLSWCIAGMIAVLFFVFMGGYFWGYKKSSDYFINKLEEGSLADQISSSMYARYDQSDAPETGDEGDESEEPEDGDSSSEQDSGDTTSTVSTSEKKDTQKVTSDIKNDGKTYYAQLVGYGSQKSATAFAAKLQKKGIAAQVRTRYSKTNRGKQIAWYQVVTAAHSSRDELAGLVKRIAEEERLKEKDICIITC